MRARTLIGKSIKPRGGIRNRPSWRKKYAKRILAIVSGNLSRIVKIRRTGARKDSGGFHPPVNRLIKVVVLNFSIIFS